MDMGWGRDELGGSGEDWEMIWGRDELGGSGDGLGDGLGDESGDGSGDGLGGGLVEIFVVGEFVIGEGYVVV